MAKNCVIGAGGMVASHLCDHILEHGEEVIATVRWNEDLFRIRHIEDKMKIVSMNLLDLSSIIRCFADNKPDYIYLLAAESFVNDSFTNPIITVETNTIGTLNVCEAVRLIKDYIHKDWDPVVHVCSSSEFYGKVDKEELPITEKHPPRPGNQYAIGKVGADFVADLYFKYYGLKTIRTRMFTHTSGRRTMGSAEVNFAKQIARIEKGLQEPVVKHGNLNSVRTWADARDAARAYYLLVRNCTPGEVYNIGGETVKTVGECLDYLISLSTKRNEIQKELDPRLVRNVDVDMQVVDCSKFKKEIGWKPEITFEQTMQDVLNAWRERV